MQFKHLLCVSMAANRGIQLSVWALPAVLVGVMGLSAGCSVTVLDPVSASVTVTSTGCPAVTGVSTGVRVSREYVVTVAHGVAGSSAVLVSTGSGRRKLEVDAVVVLIDRQQDLALLRIKPSGGAVITLGRDRAAGQATLGLRRGVQAVSVKRRVNQHTTTIDRVVNTANPKVWRLGYELNANVAKGDSGAPLIVNGRVVGVLWARSTSEGFASADGSDSGSDSGAAWVVDISASIRKAVHLGALRERVDTGACVG
jgi:Trypsin-like peptidase domain